MHLADWQVCLLNPGRKVMNRVLNVLCIAVTLSVANVRAQTIQDLAGTWTLVAVYVERDGVKTDTYGPQPRGILAVDANGSYALVIARSGLPRFASNNRTTGTNEENQAVVSGSLAHFGTLSIDTVDKAIIFRIAASTFPNWDGTEQKRPFTLKGDELRYVAVGSGGGSGPVIWRRAK